MKLNILQSLLVDYHLVSQGVGGGRPLPPWNCGLVRYGCQPSIQTHLEGVHSDSLHVPDVLGYQVEQPGPLHLFLTAAADWVAPADLSCHSDGMGAGASDQALGELPDEYPFTELCQALFKMPLLGQLVRVGYSQETLQPQAKYLADVTPFS